MSPHPLLLHLQKLAARKDQLAIRSRLMGVR